MFLVDTSVWIDFLGGGKTQTAHFLEELLENPLACGITDQVYLEILQGARDEHALDTLQQYFSGQRFYRFEDPLKGHEQAARIYFGCRRQGITIRSSIDCLIAQCAREHQLTLLHHDSDYVKMKQLVPDLAQKHFLQG